LLLLTIAIGVPVFIFIVIPNGLSAAFNRDGTGEYNFEFIKFYRFVDKSRIDDSSLSTDSNPPVEYIKSAENFYTELGVDGIVGGFLFGTKVNKSNYAVPFNVPLNVKGPVVWSMKISTSHVLSETPNSDDGKWASFADFLIPGDSHVANDYLHIDAPFVPFRMPSKLTFRKKIKY
jgi:hypothetical protein